ncbi:MAG: radical SAM protein [Acidobacteriota bacterium]
MSSLKKRHILRAWHRILGGWSPNLSIEITRECPLSCPGCYAYEPGHLGDAGPLRSLADFRGEELVDGVLDLVSRYRPIHLSLVGGEPLVCYRELDLLLPRLSRQGIAVQVVTSAVRPIPARWRDIDGLNVVVSIDGLQREHDERRAPATYARILKNVEGQWMTVHCTVTRQMAERMASFGEFLSFWSNRPEVRKIWFSLFTPQVGAGGDEVLPAALRDQVLEELRRLRAGHAKLFLPDRLIEGYRHPPSSPAECLFARTTACFSSDLRTTITPCQLGGVPDCAQCGCLASAGLKSLGEYRLFNAVPLRKLYAGSERIGQVLARRRERAAARARQPTGGSPSTSGLAGGGGAEGRRARLGQPVRE